MAGIQDNVGEIVRDRFLAFLSRFSEKVSAGADSSYADAEIETYVKQIEKMKELGLTVMMVDYAHVMVYDAPLAQAVAETFVRFEPFLKLALQQLIQQFHPDFLFEEHSTTPKDFYVAFYNMPSHIKCVGGPGGGWPCAPPPCPSAPFPTANTSPATPTHPLPPAGCAS